MSRYTSVCTWMKVCGKRANRITSVAFTSPIGMTASPTIRIVTKIVLWLKNQKRGGGMMFLAPSKHILCVNSLRRTLWLEAHHGCDLLKTYRDASNIDLWCWTSLFYYSTCLYSFMMLHNDACNLFWRCGTIKTTEARFSHLGLLQSDCSCDDGYFESSRSSHFSETYLHYFV